MSAARQFHWSSLFTEKAVGGKDVFQSGTLRSPHVAALGDLKSCSQTFKYKPSFKCFKCCV